MERLIQIIFLILVNISVAACSSADYNNGEISDKEIAEIISRTTPVYNEYCSGCHESDIKEFSNGNFIHGKNPESIYQSIAEGRNSGEMPSFKDAFSDAQIKDMVITILHSANTLANFDLKLSGTDSEVYESRHFNFKLKKVIDEISSPWGMAFLPEGGFLVTDKSGELYRVNKLNQKIKIKGVPSVKYRSQGGLMDVELHPNFKENGFIYLSFTAFDKNDDDLTTTAVSRYKLIDDELREEKQIFIALPFVDSGVHFGSRLEFDDKGYLYITIGDRGQRDTHPQDLSTYPGKVHRVNDDGTIPSDNPYVNNNTAISSIYSYGHRNPQGMRKNPNTGEIWTHEHGPRGGDEINIIKPGLNYGWPVISYGINYSGTKFTELTEKEGMEQPFHYWTPSIAPSGMEFVKGDIYPGWEGDLLVGSLSFRFLGLYEIEGDKLVREERLLMDMGRVRNVKQGPDGYIYVAFEDPGIIYKIVPIND